MKSFLGNFYRYLAIFIGSHWLIGNGRAIKPFSWQANLKQFCLYFFGHKICTASYRALASVSLLDLYSNGKVVVGELVERSFPITEVRGSNPVIGKNLF